MCAVLCCALTAATMGQHKSYMRRRAIRFVLLTALQAIADDPSPSPLQPDNIMSRTTHCSFKLRAGAPRPLHTSPPVVANMASPTLQHFIQEQASDR